MVLLNFPSQISKHVGKENDLNSPLVRRNESVTGSRILSQI